MFAALGIAFLLEPRWLLPLTAVFLLPALVVLARDMLRRRTPVPFILGVAASAAILFGKFHLESDPVMYAGMALLVAASIWSAAPARKRGGEIMTVRRVFEVFSAGCPLCSEAVTKIQELACPSCEVRVLDMNDPNVAKRARGLGIRSVPAVAIDGQLADCCSSRGIDIGALKAHGLGSVNGGSS